MANVLMKLQFRESVGMSKPETVDEDDVEVSGFAVIGSLYAFA